MIYGPPCPQRAGRLARGSYPVNGKRPDDRPADWPRIETIRRYNKQTRLLVDQALDRATDTLMFHVAIEHRLMHAETLAYMFHWLPFEWKHRPRRFSVSHGPVDRSNAQRMVAIPAGHATLGLKRRNPFV